MQALIDAGYLAKSLFVIPSLQEATIHRGSVLPVPPHHPPHTPWPTARNALPDISSSLHRDWTNVSNGLRKFLPKEVLLLPKTLIPREASLFPSPRPLLSKHRDGLQLLS